MPKRYAMRRIPKYDAVNNIGAVDRVRFCIVNNRLDDLTLSEKEQMDRWRQIDAWIRQKRYKTINDKGKDDEAPVHGHQQLRALTMSFFQISWDTAERDIANTKKFCSTAYDDQEYFRSVYIEDAERLAEEAARMGQYTASEKFLRLAADLRGHFDDIMEEIPEDKMEAFQLLIEYNPEAVGLKTIPDKEMHFERWKKRKRSISESMNLEANDATTE